MILGNKEEILKDVGARMRQRRLRQNLSQAEVAERSGISAATLKNFENGCGMSLWGFISPDQAWDGMTYGYLGKAMRSFRETRHMEATTDCLEVYNTESYDVDGYRFKLEPGTYRLRMLFHCGWEPDWRADWWLFDVTANGQALAKPFDLYKDVGGDINQAAALEKDVTVGADGLLTVRFVHVPGKGRDPCG